MVGSSVERPRSTDVSNAAITAFPSCHYSSVSSFPLPPAVRRTKYRGARTNPWDPIGSLACAAMIIQSPVHDVNRPRGVRQSHRFRKGHNTSTDTDSKKNMAL